MNQDNIYRIFTPSELDRFVEGIPKTRLRMVVETLLYTGMRYEELKDFSGNLQWLDVQNRAITLPGSFSKTGKLRVIQLTPDFTKRLAQYLKEYKTLEVPCQRTMETNFQRWWVGDEWTPTPKTLRKTWESWLIFAGYDLLKVALSQGHTQVIALNHYITMSARLKSELEAVKEKTKGWGT